jgi:hypothetical protein
MPNIARFKFRFSLLNLLLTMAGVALSFAVCRLGSEVVPLKRENKRLNDERGTLVIEDRSLLHAIRVPTRFARNPGTFRVFIPDGKKYVAIVAVNAIPKSGFPVVKRQDASDMILGQAGKNAFATLPPGEHQVSLSVEERNNRARDVRFATTAQGFTLDMTVQIPKGAWPETKPETYSVYGDGVYGKTVTAAAGQSLVLMRHRIQAASSESLNVSYSMPEPDLPLDGMMLWIEPLDSK